jgi:hypothetical protein
MRNNLVQNSRVINILFTILQNYLLFIFILYFHFNSSAAIQQGRLLRKKNALNETLERFYEI